MLRPENIYPNLWGVFPTKDDKDRKEKQRGKKKKKKATGNWQEGEKKGGEIKETYAQRPLV